MNRSDPSAHPATFLERLHVAGIEPGDSEETRLNKSLLMLATGLACVALMGWVGLYSALGQALSITPPLIFQAISSPISQSRLS